jgi:hypothetical protein
MGWLVTKWTARHGPLAPAPVVNRTRTAHRKVLEFCRSRALRRTNPERSYMNKRIVRSGLAIAMAGAVC